MIRKQVGESLRDAVVVLIASPPETPIREAELRDAEILEADHAAAAVDEAVLALARAVLAQGGTLAVPSDAYCTPLVAQVAAEYWSPAPIENADSKESIRSGKVLVYGFSEFREIVLRSPAMAVRERGAISPVALVLAGGGGKELDEAGYWQQRIQSRFFVPIPATGGAAAGFESPRERELTARLRALREETRGQERLFPSEPEKDQPLEYPNEDRRQFEFSHYPFDDEALSRRNRVLVERKCQTLANSGSNIWNFFKM